MKGAPLATYSALILCFHGLLAVAGLAGIFHYFHTVFYPLFPFLAFVGSIVAVWERDRKKWPGLITGLTALAIIIHWVMMIFIIPHP